MTRRPFSEANGGSRFGNGSAQALIEFVFVVFMMVALLFGLIDFGRAIYEKEVLTNLSREGANLASRGASLSNTVAAVMAGAGTLNFTNNGLIIVSSVFNSNNTYYVTAQVSQGGLAVKSKVGSAGGKATMPAAAIPIPQSNQTVYVTEVFYQFKSITPIGTILNVAMTNQLYDAAYF